MIRILINSFKLNQIFKVHTTWLPWSQIQPRHVWIYLMSGYTVGHFDDDVFLLMIIFSDVIWTHNPLTDHETYRAISSNESLKKEMEAIVPIMQIKNIDSVNVPEVNLSFDEEGKKVMKMESMKKLETFTQDVLNNPENEWSSRKVSFLLGITLGLKDMIVINKLYQFFRQLLYNNPQLKDLSLNGHHYNIISALRYLQYEIKVYISRTRRLGWGFHICVQLPLLHWPNFDLFSSEYII